MQAGHSCTGKGPNVTYAYIFDTETTGFNEPQVIQAASLAISLEGEIGESYTQFFCPSKPIEYGAKAIHHILECDLESSPPSSAFVFNNFVNTPYVIGHNIDYDWEVSGKPAVKRICTLALARHFWPTMDSHSQSALMYLHFGDQARAFLVGAHDAGEDVLNLGRLWKGLFLPKLRHVIGGWPTWEEIWQVSEDARIPRVMTFGKYKGQSINDVDRGYIQWYLRQPDTDPYVVSAFHRVLKGERL